jgi:uncharacterized protein YceH (UPF0502 family)
MMTQAPPSVRSAEMLDLEERVAALEQRVAELTERLALERESVKREESVEDIIRKVPIL